MDVKLLGVGAIAITVIILVFKLLFSKKTTINKPISTNESPEEELSKKKKGAVQPTAKGELLKEKPSKEGSVKEAPLPATVRHRTKTNRLSAKFEGQPIMGSPMLNKSASKTYTGSSNNSSSPERQELLKSFSKVIEEYHSLYVGGPWGSSKNVCTSSYLLRLIPPSKHYLLTVNRKRSSRVVATKAKSTAPLEIKPDTNGEFKIPDELSDGEFEATVTLTHLDSYPSLPDPVTFRMSAGKPFPSEIQLKDVASLRMVFSSNDIPLSNATATGEFESSNNSIPVSGRVSGRTNVDGFVEFPFPSGSMTKVQATSEQGVTVKRTEKIPIQVENLINTSNSSNNTSSGRQGPQKFMHVSADASNCAAAVKWMSTEGTKALILGDVSGSMSYDSRMAILRSSLTRIANKIVAQKGQFALAVWDAWFYPMSTSWKSSMDAEIQSWINNRIAQGANDMRYAIEQALQLFPDATDVWVMCDGDVSPFQLSGSTSCEPITKNVAKPATNWSESCSSSYKGTNWKAFRARFPRVRFHFIAFAQSADRLTMPTMADQGGGCFEQFDFRSS